MLWALRCRWPTVQLGGIFTAFDHIYLLTNIYLHAILFWCAASLGNPNPARNLAAI
jgi:hypothetical protein